MDHVLMDSPLTQGANGDEVSVKGVAKCIQAT